MKKYLLSILAITSFVLSGFAQVPNGGFENWTVATYPDPVGWPSANILVFANPSNPRSVYQATATADVHGGASAMAIHTVSLVTNPLPTMLDDVWGICMTGYVAFPNLKQGFASTQKPLQMEFYAKYTPNGVDTAIALVWLQKRNGSQVDTIAAGGTILTGTTSTYAQYTTVLNYNPNYAHLTPDTMVVVFSSSALYEANRKVGSVLYVDDVTLTGTYNSVNAIDAPEVSVFPNPANTELNFSNVPSSATKIIVYDIAGRKQLEQNLTSVSLNIDTQSWNAGAYSYELLDSKSNAVYRGKVLIKH
ncbi:MAG: T9SS type A sorting domain-containing protein [Bacteroidetes bacterium]|nr:T9SS type A sorting domain-containing protein [Bacteroidota bacterium]